MRMTKTIAIIGAALVLASCSVKGKNMNPAAATANTANNGTGGATNLTPGVPMVNGVSGGLIKDASGNVTAGVATAAKTSLTVSASGGTASFAFSSLPAFGHGGNIRNDLTPYLYVNRLGRGVPGTWSGTTATFNAGLIKGDRGNMYVAGSAGGSNYGAIWAQLEGATAGSGTQIVSDPDASQKLHVLF